MIHRVGPILYSTRLLGISRKVNFYRLSVVLVGGATYLEDDDRRLQELLADVERVLVDANVGKKVVGKCVSAICSFVSMHLMKAITHCLHVAAIELQHYQSEPEKWHDDHVNSVRREYCQHLIHNIIPCEPMPLTCEALWLLLPE